MHRGAGPCHLNHALLLPFLGCLFPPESQTPWQAVQLLHDRGIVHRDLKPENLLCADDRPDAEVKVSRGGREGGRLSALYLWGRKDVALFVVGGPLSCASLVCCHHPMTFHSIFQKPYRDGWSVSDCRLWLEQDCGWRRRPGNSMRNTRVRRARFVCLHSRSANRDIIVPYLSLPSHPPPSFSSPSFLPV